MPVIECGHRADTERHGDGERGAGMFHFLFGYHPFWRRLDILIYQKYKKKMAIQKKVTSWVGLIEMKVTGLVKKTEPQQMALGGFCRVAGGWS